MLTQSRAGDASALAELKTQLKGHSQTIEMLVEEKLELQKLRTDAEQQAEAVRWVGAGGGAVCFQHLLQPLTHTRSPFSTPSCIGSFI